MDKLDQVLADALRNASVKDPQVEVHALDLPGEVFVLVSSETLRTLPEEDRQRIAWEAIADALSPEDQIRIRYVVTNPDELSDAANS